MFFGGKGERESVCGERGEEEEGENGLGMTGVP
jgi:hypothetical protein